MTDGRPRGASRPTRPASEEPRATALPRPADPTAPRGGVIAHGAGPGAAADVAGSVPATELPDGALSTATRSAPAPVPLPDTAAHHEVPRLLTAHGCWYPSADPEGRHVAYICDRTGVPQLWAGPVDGDEVHLLDADTDPVTEVSWSPDGRWIAYTTAPGGGEHTRVLCVRPDGSGRRLLAGGEPGSSAHLGCWQHDGSTVAVTVAEGAAGTVPGDRASAPEGMGHQGPVPFHRGEGSRFHQGEGNRWGNRGELPTGPSSPPAAPSHSLTGGGAPTAAGVPASVGGSPPKTLSVYLVDPEGESAPVLVASERGAATLRLCDLSRDGELALLRRGPRGRREALVVRTGDLRVACRVPVADGDPWIGGFSPDGRTLWLRSDHGREHAALCAVRLDAHGQRRAVTVAAQREECDLELLALDRNGRSAVLSWNVRGVSELEVEAFLPVGPADHALGRDGAAGRPPSEEDGAQGAAGSASPAGPALAVSCVVVGPGRTVPLPHEVVTRIAVTADPGDPVVALSGSQRRPGVWRLHRGAPLRTPWSSADQDVAPGSHPPVRPAPMRPVARDGLALGGWYYRAPGRPAGEPAPCVVHLHGGPEDQERPVFDPLYHELLGRGLDVFAPDVRGSSGYGRSFVEADLGAGRFAAIDDVADCVAHVVLAGLSDPRRLAVMGHSYGGYLAMASLVWHPDLFRTGVPVCGMSDFVTFFAGTEPWIAQSAAHKYGHPEGDRDLLRALSPMSRIDALRVPVLAVHGEHDTNVPPDESRQFIRAARERGLEAELLILHEEGHYFRRADNRRTFRRAAADWIQRHLTG